MATQTDFEKALSKHDGWQVWHQQDPIVQDVQAVKGPTQTITVQTGNYVAMRRDPNNVDHLIEFGGATIDEVLTSVEGWEAHQEFVGTPAQVLPEHLANSAKATRFQAVSASARDIVSDPDANELAETSRDSAIATSDVVKAAAKAVQKAVETVTSEVTKAGGSDQAAKDAGEVARSAVERAVHTSESTLAAK